MHNHTHALHIEVPDWLFSMADTFVATPNVDEWMQFVVNTSAKNVALKTGGPFAAGVFDLSSGELIALGANLVVEQGLSILHAEMVAISLAQRRLGTYDLGAEGRNLALVSSSEPCAMCYGAVPWSGVRQLICGATDADVRSIGFDEGPKLSNWDEELHKRGITVTTGVQREAATAVLKEYQRVGHIYNSRED
ncbi:nucleoside deaminase [Alteromonas facilis]|uniref:nucleoside deaminase n=1 Tax=Alteromonas facilis TaxID=2048004 RepID=UPI000C2932B3|nr:nucleoside deaminase [Alteromonas facilis]